MDRREQVQYLNQALLAEMPPVPGAGGIIFRRMRISQRRLPAL